ncbi:MAG TPA: ATP-binding protein [Rhizomicrobium sp.]
MSTPLTVKAGATVADDIQVGSFFLETLTTGMYEDPFHCIREYVQNGFDAIQDAIRSGIMKNDDGRILISIDRTSRIASLSVRDNGIGIPAAKAFSTLVSLGASRKTPAYHAGFRGIGRLAGTAYCTTLRFTTKARSENVATVVDFDCGLLRGYFSPGAEPIDIRDVVRASVKTRPIVENETEHFTQVDMIGLVNLGLEFIEPGRLHPYLQQVCPVEYSDNFEFADRVRGLSTSFGERLGVVHVETRQKRERVSIHKAYKNSYPTGRKNSVSKLHNVEVFSSKQNGWFGWIGVSNFPGEIVDETAAGVRFRVKNIQIGDSSIIESLAEELTVAGSERRLQRWAVGEIFVTNTQVVPNARRDGFEDSDAWRAIRRDVREQVVKRVIKLIRSASTTRSALKTLADALGGVSEALAAQSITPQEKSKLSSDIKRHILTLSSPDKLLGADPKDVSSLISKFKEMQERLERFKVQEPPPPEDSTKTEEQTAAADSSGNNSNEESAEGVERGVLDVVLEILQAEFGDTKAAQILRLIEAKLDEEGL